MKKRRIDDPFFMGDALLLVEDTRTREVVTACWSGDPTARRIVVRAVGGREGVTSLVRAAREQKRTTVYGLIDRDFSTTTTAPPSLFYTAWHEFENHLLDFEGLSALHLDRNAAKLAALAEAFARSAIAWMAVRHTLHEAKAALLTTPGDPTLLEVTDLATAERWLAATGYPESMTRTVGKTWTCNYLQTNRLPHHFARCEDQVARGEWLQTFSGKEVFEHLVHRGGWLHRDNDPDAVPSLLARRWARGRSPTGTIAFLTTVREVIERECRL